MPCSIAKVLLKMDQVVKPYVKSLQHITWADSPVIKRLLALSQNVLPARFRGDAAEKEKAASAPLVAPATPPKRVALRAAPPPPTRSAAPPPAPAAAKPGSRVLPATPAAASPLIPELKLEKLMAAQQSRQEGKSEIEKAGEDVARSMGDLFANIGGSMDNLFQQADAEKPPVRQRGTIVA